ncbi:MAG: hypothetical protein AB8G16_03780 [Gammaproteobacteria bacterium]
MSITTHRRIAAVLVALFCVAHMSSLASPQAGGDRWIVELTDKPFAQISNTSRPRDARHSHEGRAALEQIAASQVQLATAMSAALGRRVEVSQRYQYALVGMVVTATAAEARLIENLPGVASVTPDSMLSNKTDTPRSLLTSDIAGRINASADPVAALIGAPAVWDGSATGDAGHLGEGVIVGVVSSGINGDHPSFAAVGDDNYQHINPFGDGNYVGDCFATPAITCNNKLIGRWNFALGGVSSEDTDG